MLAAAMGRQAWTSWRGCQCLHSLNVLTRGEASSVRQRQQQEKPDFSKHTSLQAARRRPAAPLSAAADAPRPRWFSQDRISTDGRLVTNINAPAPAAPYVIGSSIAGSGPVPEVPPASEADLERLEEFVLAARGSLVILTGAGASTESSIPDYRSPNGAYSTGFRPMTHQQFMASDENRSRYWSRSFAGWPRFRAVAPNAAHAGIARLQALGWAGPLITQNVDRLHHAAGSTAITELHGTTHRVVCMGCGALSCRDEVQARMAELNPGAAAALEGVQARGADPGEALRHPGAGTAAPLPSLQERGLVQRPDGEVEAPGPAPVQRPDGDVELGTGAGRGFAVPPCSACGGLLKPWVVFFGDSLPGERAAEALRLAGGCRGLLVVGSSLAVYSAFRLAKAATDGGAALGIVTAGPTRADGLAGLKLEARAGEVLARLAARPALQLPP